MDAAASNLSMAGSASGQQLNDLASLWTFFLSFSALRDWVKLIVLGGALESCRRFASSLWSRLLESFFLTAYFEYEDDSYGNVMLDCAFICQPLIP
jgi:chaperone BCS1